MTELLIILVLTLCIQGCCRFFLAQPVENEMKEKAMGIYGGRGATSEREACDMALEMILLCRPHYRLEKTCPARKWLDKCGMACAWEVVL